MTRRSGLLLLLLAILCVATLGTVAASRFNAARRDWEKLVTRLAAQQFDGGAARCVTLVLSPAQRRALGIQDLFEPAAWARLLTLPGDELRRGCECVGTGLAQDARSFFDARVWANWMLPGVWSPLGEDVATALRRTNEEWRVAQSGAALRRRLQACLAPR